jgi:chitinase
MNSGMGITLPSICLQYDIIMLSFVTPWGNGRVPKLRMVQCNTDERGNGCESIIPAIENCMNQGTQFILSLGGANDEGSGFSSVQDAKDFALKLHESFGSGKSVIRPLGSVSLLGIDLDFENQAGYSHLTEFVEEMRKLEPNWCITAAPQCPIPDRALGSLIQSTPLDLLLVQFYNNPSCSNNVYPKSDYNFPHWMNVSNGAKIIVGALVPIEQDGQVMNREQGAISAYSLAAQLSGLQEKNAFAGCSLWSTEDAAKLEGFVQPIKAALKKKPFISESNASAQSVFGLMTLFVLFFW